MKIKAILFKENNLHYVMASVFTWIFFCNIRVFICIRFTFKKRKLCTAERYCMTSLW